MTSQTSSPPSPASTPAARHHRGAHDGMAIMFCGLAASGKP
ncbi:MAG: hypothetical protein ACJ780_19105 [Solirubrobacteraceae bacterium]